MLFDRENTGRGDSWVEYCYVINIQENTFTVYTKLDLPLLKVYSLDKLPDSKSFVDELAMIEEDADE